MTTNRPGVIRVGKAPADFKIPSFDQKLFQVQTTAYALIDGLQRQIVELKTRIRALERDR